VNGAGLRTFYTLAITQTLSLVGSRMSSIAVSIWVFAQTGSAAPLLLVSFFNEVPAMIGGSLAGVLADRWDRRHVMILADVGQALGTLALLVSIASGTFALWQLYAVALAQGIFAMFQQPAADAAVTMLVPPRHLDRANGIRQMAFPLAGVIAPALTGMLYAVVGLGGVIAIDLATFLVSVGVLAAIRIPRPAQTDAGALAQGGFWRELRGGFAFLLTRRPLLLLIGYLTLVNFLLNGPLDLSLPYLITVTGSEQTAGLILGAMSAGALAGAAAITAWGGTRARARVRLLLVGMAFTGVLFLVYGTVRAPLLLALALFALMIPLPVSNALFVSILQTKTPPDMQGRVFSIAFQVAFLVTPLSFVIVGPLVDNVLEPAVGTPGWDAVAPLVGSAPGAGMGLVLVATGVLILALTALAWALPGLRRLEAALPDYEVAHD
jgi:hypothetical protein